MNAQQPNHDPVELASLYAAGAMSEPEVRWFESHLAACARCAAQVRGLGTAVRELLESVPPVEPGPRVRERLLASIQPPMPPGTASGQVRQVWKDWPDSPRDPVPFVCRAEDGPWEPTQIAGVDVRRLFVDRQRNQITMLVRMAAGTAYPEHRHGGAEECYVLRGDLSVGEDVLTAGDYQCAPAGSRHGVQSTRDGCLLLIVSSLSDELESN